VQSQVFEKRVLASSTNPVPALELVNLTPVMERTSGQPDVLIGLIDGPVAMQHPELNARNMREVSASAPGACSRSDSAACMHGTFVAGILSATRGSNAPAIAPNCTLLVRPIFSETPRNNMGMPSSTPEELSIAITETVDAGARVLNLSVALLDASPGAERLLDEAINYAARRGVLVIAASGNQGVVGSSAITAHPWVLPVIACDWNGRPTSESNLSGSVGKRGLSAPGERIVSLGADSKQRSLDGTSVAAPFVTGAIALLWSEFPGVSAVELRRAVTERRNGRSSIVPPLLNAWAAYQVLGGTHDRRKAH
jgi:subtilisin family serine protease